MFTVRSTASMAWRPAPVRLDDSGIGCDLDGASEDTGEIRAEMVPEFATVAATPTKIAVPFAPVAWTRPELFTVAMTSAEIAVAVRGICKDLAGAQIVHGCRGICGDGDAVHPVASMVPELAVTVMVTATIPARSAEMMPEFATVACPPLWPHRPCLSPGPGRRCSGSP